jgi:hypothetical protein
LPPVVFRICSTVYEICSEKIASGPVCGATSPIFTVFVAAVADLPNPTVNALAAAVCSIWRLLIFVAHYPPQTLSVSASADFVMPTLPGAAGLIPRLPARRVARLGGLHPPPMNHVFGIFRRDTGQGEVELDFRERYVQFPTGT